MTILSRLHAKGSWSGPGRDARTCTRRGRRAGPRGRRMATVLADEPDREAVLARFVSGLSESDEQLLRRMLGTEDAGSD